MLTKEQKIEAIYEKIANKELSLGCQIIIPCGRENHQYTIMDDSFESEKGKETFYCRSNAIWSGLCKRLDITEIKEIIGHPVMLGCILDYIETNNLLEYGRNIFGETIQLWGERRKPIEDQSEQCIDFIYNLIEEGQTKNNT